MTRVRAREPRVARAAEGAPHAQGPLGPGAAPASAAAAGTAAVDGGTFERAAKPRAPRAPLRRATVVGAGPAGLAQASLLIQRAKDVGLEELTVVELRGAYSRPVGLALRQMNLDALAWLNPDAHAALAQRSGLEGAPFVEGKPAAEPGDAARFERERLNDTDASVAAHAQAMMSQTTVALVTLKDVEECYWQGLEALAAKHGVTLRKVREHDVEVEKDGDGNVALAVTPMRVAKDGERRPAGPTEALPAQDLVVVAQGVNCAVRKKLGTGPGETASSADRFIAGVMDEPTKTEGPAQSVYREDVVTDAATGEASTVRMVRGVHARNGKHWCLVQVPDHVRFAARIDDVPAADRERLRAALTEKLGRAPEDAEVVGARVAEEVEAYFRAQHAKTGDATLPISFGPSLFTMQAKRFDSAILGNNTVAVGDAVGTSHFNVSGGAATGLTTHTLALDRFLSARAAGVPAQEALRALDVELQQATLVWQLFGITQFEGDPAELRDTFYPRDRLAQILSPDVLELYWPKDGGLPKEGPWRDWLAVRAAPSSRAPSGHVEPPPEVVQALARAPKQSVQPIACVNPSALLFATDAAP